MEHRQGVASGATPARARLPGRERLRGRAEFRRVYEEGDAHHGRLLVLFVLRGTDLDRRVGFVSGRKIGGAVQRNRARRLLREAYRRLRPNLIDYGAGVHFVIVGRRTMGRGSLAATLEELRRLMQVAGVLNGAGGTHA